MRKLSIILATLIALGTVLWSLPLQEASAQESPNLAPPVLYAGSSGPGHVYQYLGDSDWRMIADWEDFDNDVYAVVDLVEYQGQLYAGVTTGYGGMTGVGRVYVWDGATSWTCVGNNMDHAVTSLAVYKGDLYAGTGRGAFRLYKYTPGETDCGIQNWTRVVNTGWNGVRSLHVSYASGQHLLLMGDAYYDRFAHWDGENFFEDRTNADGSCIYDFADFGDHVYASAYNGRLFKSSDGQNWQVELGYYDGPMWTLERVQDKLYMGYDSGALMVWDGSGSARGTQVDVDPSTAGANPAPDGIISMATDGRDLYFGTGGDAVGFPYTIGGIGNVYRYDGTSVQRISDHDQFGEGVQVLYSPEKVVLGYMWQDLSVLEGKQLTHVVESFAWVDSRVQGYLTTAHLRKGTFVQAAEARNMIPLVSIQQASDKQTRGRGANQWQVVLRDADMRSELISSIVDLLAEAGYKGVDVDLEGLGVRDVEPYRDFVLELRQALDGDVRTQRPRRLITVAVQGTYLNRYSIADLIGAVDYVMVMGYDYYYGDKPLGPWKTDPTQHQRTRVWLCVLSHIDELVDLGYPAERVIYLLPFYAKWGNNSFVFWKDLTPTQRESVTNATMNEHYLEKLVTLSITGRPRGETMYWTDPQCVAAKVGAALFENAITLADGRRGNIGGAGAWQIGQDDADSQLTKALWNASQGL